jgi:hypothetical protein
VKHAFAVKSVWTQSLLEYLVSTNHISSEKYQKLLIQLILANYVHTSISVYTVEEAARQSNWKPHTLFEKVVNVLSGFYSEESSAMDIVVESAFRLYSQSFFMADPDPLFSSILNAFFTSRDRRVETVIRLLSRLRARFAQLPFQRQEIELFLQQWSQKHILF